MRIAMIYEYGDESWSTPYSIIKEFGKRGHSVDRFHLTNGEEVSVLNKQYDIVIVMDWKGIDIPNRIKNALKNKGTYLIRECADTPQNYYNHLKCVDEYDLLLTPDYQSCEQYKAAGYNAIWWNHFADTDIHTLFRTSDNYPPVRSTRGPGGSQLMDQLSKIIPDKFINKNGLMGEEYGKFLHCGNIVFQNSRWREITRRIFEGMACCRLVITDRLPKETMIDSLFVENEDIVYYDNITEAISKINYYLSDEGKEERINIALNGYKKTMQSHTQVQRVDAILNEYNKTNIFI